LDPDELQEVGLFLLLGIIMAGLMRGTIRGYERAIGYVLYALFAAGIAMVVYGLVLEERTKRLVKKE
jgi:hypothetical protein